MIPTPQQIHETRLQAALAPRDPNDEALNLIGLPLSALTDGGWESSPRGPRLLDLTSPSGEEYTVALDRKGDILFQVRGSRAAWSQWSAETAVTARLLQATASALASRVGGAD